MTDLRLDRQRMPGYPCFNHPSETTYVRCGRCDRPICVRCMVDSPVGKKCRECAQNRTHLDISTPRQALQAFVAALAGALVLGIILHQIPYLLILAFPYGYLVAEIALRAGQRSRSLAIQVATGAAAFLGSAVGAGLTLPTGPGEGFDFAPLAVLSVWGLLVTAIGVVVAVGRVRFL